MLDPATGHEQEIMEAPADLLRASLSPDGRWVMLSGMGPGNPWTSRVYLADLATHQIRLTPLEDEASRNTPVVWLKDRLVLPVNGRVQTCHLDDGRFEVKQSGAWWWESASPDDRYIAGFHVHFGEENEHWLAPATLYLHHLTTGEEREFPDLIRYRLRFKDEYPRIPVQWDERSDFDRGCACDREFAG